MEQAREGFEGGATRDAYIISSYPLSTLANWTYIKENSSYRQYRPTASLTCGSCSRQPLPPVHLASDASVRAIRQMAGSEREGRYTRTSYARIRQYRCAIRHSVHSISTRSGRVDIKHSNQRHPCRCLGTAYWTCGGIEHRAPVSSSMSCCNHASAPIIMQYHLCRPHTVYLPAFCHPLDTIHEDQNIYIIPITLRSCPSRSWHRQIHRT